MRCGGKQKHGFSATSQLLQHLISLTSVELVAILPAGEPVCFIDNNQIPWLCLHERVEMLILFKAIHGTYNIIKHLPVSWIVYSEVITVYQEFIQAELSGHFLLPLPRQSGRSDEEEATSFATLPECRQKQADLDGFPKADIIRNQPVILTRSQNVMNKMDLVW